MFRFIACELPAINYITIHIFISKGKGRADFGDNIDFARGTSYMEFLELWHDFYETYDLSIENGKAK